MQNRKENFWKIVLSNVKMWCYFHTALGPSRAPVRWVLGSLSPGMGAAGSWAGHSSPSGAEIGSAWRCV